MRRIVLVLVLLVSSLGVATAQLPELRKRAAQGDAEAMLKLSEKYLFGFGVTENEDSSKYWLKRALATGDSEAQYLVGLQYTGIPKDARQYDEGVDLLQQSGEQDNRHALLRLSEIYRQRRTGTDSDRYYNLTKAYHFAVRSAQLGHKEGMVYAAECLLTGEGVEQDDSMGVAWMRRSADEKQFFPAMIRMGELLLGGTGQEHPAPFEALNYYRKVLASPAANVDQKSQAKIGIHEVDKALKELQNVMFEAGSFLPPAAFQYEIRE